MKVIFLDIDGVLNEHEWMIKKTDWINTYKLSLISNLCKITDAKVVLSSNWRDVWFEPMFYKNSNNAIYWRHKKFLDNNIDVVGVTLCKTKIIYKEYGNSWTLECETENCFLFTVRGI